MKKPPEGGFCFAMPSCPLCGLATKARSRGNFADGVMAHEGHWQRGRRLPLSDRQAAHQA
ncbi:MAG: hypothetical protein LBG78_05670 [Azoarcus sp.]|nr:hypothetical protein [Azoarcus sp.]